MGIWGKAAAAVLWAGAAQAQVAPVGPDAWIDHLVSDMMPFWTMPDALGTPIGNFPTTRCNDGTVPSGACDGVSAFRAANPQHSIVAQSRQVFSYGVAFHMTGEAQYLDHAKAGAAYLFDNAVDAGSGLFNEVQDVNSGVWGPAAASRNVQKQSYGLLGPTFLYYLTRDDALYAQISSVSAAINRDFFNDAAGAFGWNPADTAPSGRITAHLDPLNSYLHLMSTVAPDADRAAIKAQTHKIATYLRDEFFDPSRGLFTVNKAAATDAVDFGHSAKSLWFIAMAGAQSGDAALVQFAATEARQLFAQAFVAPSGSWASSTGSAGRDDTANWWISAELDQLAASLSLADPSFRAWLAETQYFWLTHFVDETNKGIWERVSALTGEPLPNQHKQWEWKSGFHEFEHALVSYLAAGQIQDGESVLYFAQQAEFDFDTAYLFDVESAAAEILAGGLQKVTFGGLSFAGIAAPVPLPAAAGLMLLGLGALTGLARRRAA